MYLVVRPYFQKFPPTPDCSTLRVERYRKPVGIPVGLHFNFRACTLSGGRMGSSQAKPMPASNHARAARPREAAGGGPSPAPRRSNAMITPVGRRWAGYCRCSFVEVVPRALDSQGGAVGSMGLGRQNGGDSGGHGGGACRRHAPARHQFNTVAGLVAGRHQWCHL